MKKYFFLFAIFLFVIGTVNAQTYKIIVNNSNSTTSLSKAEVSNLFLKKKTKWSSGTEVKPVDLSPKSDLREAFSKEIHGKTIAQVRAYWQQTVFAGKATPPSEMDGITKVVEYVKANPGAIGYVSADANVSGVKVLSIN